MLARTDDFLPAKALGISEVDRNAAIEVLRMLEAGILQFVPLKPTDGTHGKFEPHSGGFNMRMWGENRCGPFAGCIGAWMEVVKGRELSERTHGRFNDVFMPWDYPVCMCAATELTPERSAWALRTKLTTGYADWGVPALPFEMAA
jgi:hypothetical protein